MQPALGMGKPINLNLSKYNSKVSLMNRTVHVLEKWRAGNLCGVPASHKVDGRLGVLAECPGGQSLIGGRRWGEFCGEPVTRTSMEDCAKYASACDPTVSTPKWEGRCCNLGQTVHAHGFRPLALRRGKIEGACVAVCPCLV